MAWLESIRTSLPPLLYDGLLTTVIALLTLGLAWGLRPAIQLIFGRLGAKWSTWGAVGIQILCLFGGMTLIAIAVGVNALLLTIMVVLAFVSGMAVGGETAFADRIATVRLRRHPRYQVGDSVTLGRDHNGVVTRISGTATELRNAEQATVRIRNSTVLRNSIVVHQAVGPQSTTEAESDRSDTSVMAPPKASVEHATQEKLAKAESSQESRDRAQPVPAARQDGTVEQKPPATLPDTEDGIATGDGIATVESTVVASTEADEADETIGTFSTAKQLPARHRGIRSPLANTLTKRPKLGKRSAHELR